MATKSKHIKDFLYPVEKVALKDLLPGISTNNSHEFAIVVDKGKAGKKIVNTCSKQYSLIPNQEILEPVQEILKGMDVTMKSHNRFDSRFVLDITFNDISLKMGKEDNLLAKLRINNSYDGRVKYSLDLGFYRLICENGLTIPAKGMEEFNTQFKMMHTAGVAAIANREFMMETLSVFQENAKVLLDPYKEMAANKVEDAQVRMEEISKKTRFPKGKIEDAIDRLNKEMVLLKEDEPNDWLIYNALNFQLNHNEAINMDFHKKDKLDGEVMNFLLNN